MPPANVARLLPRRDELRALLQLAVPIVVIQVGIMLMGVVDTVMVGHVSARALAGVALGNLYFFVIAIFALGTLMALDPVAAQAAGAGDDAGVARAAQRGVLLAAALSVPASVLFAVAEPVLTLVRQPPDVVPLAAEYIRLMIPGTFPFLLFVVFRQTLQALHRTTALIVTIIAANVINAVLNWILIFGKIGFPALGLAGAAWATTISRWLMALGLLAGAWSILRPTLLPIRPEIWQLGPLGRMLRLGAPIGAQYQAEFGAFALVALMMGWLGTEEMAGHQVAINLASLTFMVPLGISGAAAVLVGRAIGEENAPQARRAARAALACGAAFMSVTAVVFLAMPRALAQLYTREAAVIAVASTLLPIAGVFQIFDGLQVVGSGILRGAGDTRVPLLVNLLGYWVLGLPLSLYLGFSARLGPVGLWWGLVLGLATVALVLLWRIRVRMGGRLRRVQVDLHPTQPA